MLLVAAWSRNAASAQRRGNLILLLSLIAGGCLYPSQLLPAPVAALGQLTVPHFARLGLRTISAGGGSAGLLAALWPLSVLGAIFLCAALLGLMRVKARRARHITRIRLPLSMEPREERLLKGWRRLTGTSRGKAWAMSGGFAGLAGVLIVTALCGGAAHYALSRPAPESLAIGIVLEEDTPLARELYARLSDKPGLALVPVFSEAEAAGLLARGEAEGLLVVGVGYDRALKTGEGLPLSYRSAGASASVQAAREIIAGQAVAQRAGLQALKGAGQLLGRELSPAEAEALLTLMKEEAAGLPALYKLTVDGGGAMPDSRGFGPSRLDFSLLARGD